MKVRTLLRDWGFTPDQPDQRTLVYGMVVTVA